MIVTESGFDAVLERLSHHSFLGLDTETTGLRAFHGDKIFSIIIHTGDEGYYFNFNDMNENDLRSGVVPLSRTLYPKFKRLFQNRKIRWILANAKYDMHMLAQEDLYLEGEIWDVLVMARIERNDYMKYSLDACAERIGLTKSKIVDEYIKKYRCQKKEKIPGKKGTKNNPQFWMVPLPIISEYGIQDGFVTVKIYLHQIKFFAEWETINKATSIYNIIRNEMQLTKVCFEVERRGMLLDTEYVQKAMEYEEGRAKVAAEKFKEATGHELVDSYVSLKKAFESLGIKGGLTEKGNPSFTDEVLSAIDHPAPKSLLEFRDASKRSGTYYSSFLYHSDSSGVVHCNIRQSATASGRFSISDPALQTLTSEEADDETGEYATEWRIRRAFKPRPGYCLVAIDYKAFEFRAMLDTAGEVGLANAITAGLDPHRATADLVGITRKAAKTLNFGLLYGMGSGKLAHALGISEVEAKRIRNQYFERLPSIRSLIRNAQFTAESKQRVINRFGRPYTFIDPKWAYKALNYLIQGGTADAIKVAMNRIQKEVLEANWKPGWVRPTQSYMVLQVHDELLFEVHEDELHLIHEFKRIMEEVWPEKFHKMECSVEHSWGSWGEMVDGLPAKEKSFEETLEEELKKPNYVYENMEDFKWPEGQVIPVEKIFSGK